MVGHGDTPGHPDDPEEWRHGTARVNGIELHYVSVEPDPGAVENPTGAAPLVVLLHGFPEFWYAWRHQLTPLAEAGYRVVAPDMRGYNRSFRPRGVDSYRTDELVADVRGLVGSLKADRAALVGHDWGGVVAWETAIREPELVGQLAVLNAPHPERYREAVRDSPRQLVRSWYAAAFQVPWLPERLLEAGEYRLLGGLLDSRNAVTDGERRRYREAMARTGSLSGPLNYYRAFAREAAGRELRSLLGRGRDGSVEVPTLVVWGENDAALGVELLGGLDRWVPDLRVRRLPDAGHRVQTDAPDRVTAELLSFLQ